MFALVSLLIVTCGLLQPIEGVKILQRRDWLRETKVDVQDTSNYDVKINVQVVNRAKSGFNFPEFSDDDDDESPKPYPAFQESGKTKTGIYDGDLNIFPKNHGEDKDSSSSESDENDNNNRETNKILLSPNDINSLAADPPPHEQVAKMARFIVRESNWTSMATISTRKPISGYPFANVFSVSDGPVGQSTGVPYMYLTPLEMSVIDLQEDNRASLTMSLAQSDYCSRKGYDPEDPRCAHVILTGKVAKISNTTSEYGFAKQSLFSRHPEMNLWPRDHGWFFGKLEVANILVLDYFGGAIPVSLEDYFNEN